MNFSEICQYFSQLEQTPSRLKMTEILADLFDKVDSGEIDKVVYLSLGRLAPKYSGIEINMADKMMIRVVAMAYGISVKQISQEYKNQGDLGGVVKGLGSNMEECQLSVSTVYQKLLVVSQETGNGSVERKVNMMAGLIRNCDSNSAKYIVRIPLKKLRLGFSDMTVLDALSWSKTGDKSLRKNLEKAYSVMADIGKIAFIFKSQGVEGIKKIKPQVGVPILPAKAERLSKPEEILEKMKGRCGVEPKYDGFRIQLHLDKNKKIEEKKNLNLTFFEESPQFLVKIFSRNLESTTHMFPDIVKAAKDLNVQSVILDGEAIAFNPDTGDFLPFQETVQRKRKHQIAKKSKDLPLKVFCFDVLNYNGESLLEMPFSQRRKILEKILTNGKNNTILITEQRLVTKAEDFELFFDQVVGDGLEGLMAKKMDAVYQAGARNYNWVKYKAGMQSKLADTIDCIVMGYYKGKGKRSAFGIGAFLVGIPDQEKILTVTKIGTGLTDLQWKEMYKRIEKIKISQKPQAYQVNKNLYPDVWCRPELVVEIEADTITKSPIHTAGLALRFHRLKHFRDDKDPRQATSLKELREFAKIKE